MKIVFLSYYQNINQRGNETFVSELSKRLSNNHDVEVLAGEEKKQTFSKYLPGWRLLLDPQSLLIKKFTSESLAKIGNADVIIATNGGWQSILSRLWTWRQGKKLIIPGQSGPGWDDRINLLCRPDAFVALTNYQKKWAKKNSFGVKVVEIPNGVDTQKFNPDVKAQKLNLPKPIFLCVGALEPGKHIDKTIRAVSQLSSGSLVILGNGKLKEELTKLAAKLLPGRFLITQVSHDKITPYYAAADVVTMLPPRTESFGIVFLEAMAVNKPVVTSDDPPRREIVGQAGAFVDFESVEDYTRGLKEVLRKNWANLPHQQAEKFSWDSIAQKYIKLMEELCH